MDRHFSAGCLVACLLYAGCLKSSDNATAPPAGGAENTTTSAPMMAAPAASEPAFAQPPTFSAPPTFVAPPAAAEPPALAPGSPTYGFQLTPGETSEPGSAASDAAAPAPPAPSAADSAANPLRLDFAPRPAAEPNPLRRSRIATGSEQPDSAPLAPPGAAPFEPMGGAPAGGAAAPAEPQSFAAAPPGAAADTATVSGEPFDIVQVFYATDRQSTDLNAGDWSTWLARFIPAGVSLLVAVGLGLAAATRRSFALALVALAALACTGGLGYQASAGTLAAVRRMGAAGPRYTTERSPSGRLDLGICEVSIPKTHDPGEVESPSITRLEILPDTSRHVVLQKTERHLDDSFYKLLSDRVNASPRKELFVFVHGFNVSFDDAARRTAQIHYDLKFPGAPVFFSWPAHDKFIFTYPADETNVAWSVPHLKEFLLDIVQHSQAQSINLIAHSMGNRALTAALREIDLELKGQSRLFNQVILAAPDIDADEFRTNIAPAMQRTAKQMTLYASSRDDALLASQLVHRRPRAGDAGAGLVVVNGIDTIDVTAIDTSPWGHSYYGSSDPVLNDLRELFTRAVPPRDRTWLSPAQRDGLTYWIFQAARTAAAGEDTNR